MKITKQDLQVYILRHKDWCIIWSKNSKRHREDGPASIWADGAGYYYLNGEAYNNGGYWNEIHENY